MWAGAAMGGVTAAPPAGRWTHAVAGLSIAQRAGAAPAGGRGAAAWPWPWQPPPPGGVAGGGGGRVLTGWKGESGLAGPACK